eukprot:CAMPEP_0195535806 /NCGR_PEP_ID=MMETSP0794_2-20130614/44974_1 /TAXON_ID=515487 /ORGANISM="Stephanopyxis turris, Strain CCMP 815" /LENGTH=84 /DNA_ID=CAMNT_0040669049 /DNA_START=58 /DNA_END=308 /DNA_ORIENTATION=-
MTIAGTVRLYAILTSADAIILSPLLKDASAAAKLFFRADFSLDLLGLFCFIDLAVVMEFLFMELTTGLEVFPTGLTLRLELPVG